MGKTQGYRHTQDEAHRLFREKLREWEKQDKERASWCQCDEPLPMGSICGGLDTCRKCKKSLRRRAMPALVQRLLAG